MKIFYLLLCIVLFLTFGLRLYKLDSNPPAPYWEEVALGYDAYSIFKTGKDHHGNFIPLAAFESFGDWKPSLYFYLIVPFIFLFDLTIFSVRLPAVFGGICTIFATAQIAVMLHKHYFSKKELSKKYVYVFSLFVAAISPWNILFSRAGWEAMVATALISWGVVFGIKSIEVDKNSRVSFFISALLLSLSTYAYHSARIVAPLLGLFFLFTIIVRNEKQKNILNFFKSHILTCATIVIILLPLLLQLGDNRIQHRFSETSIFSNITIIEKSNNFKELAGESFVSKLLYHRYILFGREIIHNFLSHFSISYLFLSGDENPRHSIQHFGLLYPLEIIGLIAGVFILIKKRSLYSFFLCYWLIIGILPASITLASPHSLRTLLTFPVFILGIIFGWMFLVQTLQDKATEYTKFGFLFKKLLYSLIIFTYVVQLAIFCRYYFIIYPLEHSSQWQYGYKEMYQKIADLQKINDEMPIYITRELGRPAMYYWFYTKTNPLDVQSLNSVVVKDQSEFLEYKNIYFNADFSKEQNAIFAISKNEFESLQARGFTLSSYETINDLRNQPIIYVGIYEN